MIPTRGDGREGDRALAPGDSVSHDRDNFTVTAGAGASVSALKETLASAGRHVSLSGGGTVGDAFSGGASAGGLRNEVMAVKARLPKGDVVSVGAPVFKSVAGYDLAKLFVGAEGTLGEVLEVTLKVSPGPAEVSSVPPRAGPSSFDDTLSLAVRGAFHG